MNIAIIPARGGSKRIPRKNIKEFFDKPIIAYSIEAAIKSRVFDIIMVSTDDNDIADIALEYGATVPFMRSSRTSSDFATTYDVLNEVILEYQKLGLTIETICCIYPCSPLLTDEVLISAYQKFIYSKADSLMPVVKFSYPIQRALKIEDNILSFANPEYSTSRSQDLLPMYHDVGMFYFLRVQALLREETLLCSNSAYLEMKESQIQDIDSEEDWKIAELKYRLLRR